MRIGAVVGIGLVWAVAIDDVVDLIRRCSIGEIDKVPAEKINIEEATALYESGWTTKQLAERYHISDNAVSRRLKKAGVKMRARWDY